MECAVGSGLHMLLQDKKYKQKAKKA